MDSGVADKRLGAGVTGKRSEIFALGSVGLSWEERLSAILAYLLV